MSDTVLLSPAPPAMVVEVYSLGMVGPPGPAGPASTVPGPPGPAGPGIDEAPQDGAVHGRSMTTWVQVVPVTGVTMTGPIVFAPGQVIDGGTF